MNIFSKFIYFYKRKIKPGFKVGKNELVVDVGSGDKPFWRGDVFFDNLDLGETQRASGTKTVKNMGEFVNGNFPDTPFKDRAFNFSFCAHFLEHVPDPAACIKELMRISNKGYVEVPNGVIETINPFRSHLWFVFFDNGKLVFIRKSKKMHALLVNNGKQFTGLYYKIKEPFIRIYWNKTIDFDVINDIPENEQFFPVNDEVVHSQKYNLYKVFVKIMRLFFYKNKGQIEWKKF